jgi:hypothetical protein
MKARLALTGPCLSDPETRGSDRPVTTFGVGLPTRVWDPAAGARGRMVPVARPGAPDPAAERVQVVAWGRTFAERLAPLRAGDWVRVEGRLVATRRGPDRRLEVTADYVGPAWDEPLPSVGDVFDPTGEDPPF